MSTGILTSSQKMLDKLNLFIAEFSILGATCPPLDYLYHHTLNFVGDGSLYPTRIAHDSFKPSYRVFSDLRKTPYNLFNFTSIAVAVCYRKLLFSPNELMGVCDGVQAASTCLIFPILLVFFDLLKTLLYKLFIFTPAATFHYRKLLQP